MFLYVNLYAIFCMWKKKKRFRFLDKWHMRHHAFCVLMQYCQQLDQWRLFNAVNVKFPHEFE